MKDFVRPWAVMVSGSRDMDWRHSFLIRDKLEPFAKVESNQNLVIHGAGSGHLGACGCDRVAANAASELGFRVHGYPALWNLQDKSAGPIRNKLLLEILLAHGQAGYRMAFLAFSTGGPGTEGALRGVRGCSKSHEIQIEKIDVTL